MDRKVWFVLSVFTVPAAANPAQFDLIFPKQAIVLVLPDGTCDAKVVTRGGDQMTARLKRTTRLCGKRNALVTVSRADVREVVGVAPDPGISRGGLCAIGAIAFVGGPASMAVSEGLGSNAGGLAVLVASGIAGYLFCREHRPRYGVFTDRVTPVQP